MSTTFTPAQLNKAKDSAKKNFSKADYEEFEKLLAEEKPLTAAMKLSVPTTGALREVMEALDDGTFAVVAAAKAPGTALTPLPLVGPNAAAAVGRVKVFREGSTLPTIAAGAEVPDDDVIKVLPNEISSLALEGRSMILGVTPVSLFAEFLAVIAAAREVGDPVPLIMAGVFAVTEGYTVASAWADRYSQLPKPHPFTKFEVDGRTPIKTAAGATVAAWVASSKMNSSAVHILGHMIVNAAPDGTFLKTVKDQAGTIFTPPPVEDEKERSVIMRANAKSLTEADKKAASQFAESFTKYVRVVAALFGKGDGSYEKLLDALKSGPAIMI